MGTDTTQLELTSEEKEFVREYVSLIDLASRVTKAIQSGDGDWKYVSEKFDTLATAARRLNDIISSEDAEIPEGPRELAPAFSLQPRTATSVGGGPTEPVPAGFADPGKIRAAVAALGWPYALSRVAHPVDAIEDRFAELRERARAEQSQRHPARTE